MIQMTGEEHAALVRRAEAGEKLKAALESVLQGTGNDTHGLIAAATKRVDRYKAALELIVTEAKTLNSSPAALGAIADAALRRAPAA